MTNLVNREIDTSALALEIARNAVGMKLPVSELIQQLNIDQATFLQLSKDEMFTKQVRSFKKELEENGVSFQLKARIQAEEMLKRNWSLVHDRETPAAVVVKAIENTVRWAGLEQKTGAAMVAQPGAGFQIIFNIPAAGAGSQATLAGSADNTIDITPAKPRVPA
jgi:hypothetical protein